MKFISLILCALSLQAQAKQMPHFDLEMSSEEIAQVLKSRTTTQESDSQIDNVIQFGKRNLDWLAHINSLIDSNQKLSFTSPARQPAYPIESPRIYNRQIVLKLYQDLFAVLPGEMKSVLSGDGAFPDQAPFDDAAYIDWGFKVDTVYSITARWVMMEPYLDTLADRKKEDVRGYYFLQKEENLQDKLAHFNLLSPADQQRLSGYLIGMCQNTDPGQSCTTSLRSAVSRNKVADFYNRYFNQSKSTYDGFFTLSIKRDDVNWTPSVMKIPFNDPHSTEVTNFLMNIEDEWRWEGWQLKLDFNPSAPNSARIEFVPGETPHVNGLGGNIITMDANQPMTEYGAQWTIRHEFGHVLGFDDCYIEFYDREKGTIISYQLDITNLMCSRRGKLQAKHYDQLKRVYGSSELARGN